MVEEELAALTVAELKDWLRAAGLPVSGRKAVLIERLLADNSSPQLDDERRRRKATKTAAAASDASKVKTVSKKAASPASKTKVGGKKSGSGAQTKQRRSAATSSLLRFPLMGALAVQYGLQTEFQHRYLSKGVNKLSLILVCEVIKLFIAAAALLVEESGSLRSIFSKKTFRSMPMCAIPALIYVVQNFCIQSAYTELDAITFSCLNQTKLITTATALYFIKGVKQNRKQMVALALVSAGAMLLSVKDAGGGGGGGGGEYSASTNGVAMILAASLLSGIAATLTQIFMQDMKLSPFLVTLSMCIVSIVTVGFSIISQAAMSGHDYSAIFENWTAFSLIPVATQALGGLLVGLVTNYCGSLDKGVAFVCGLAVSAFWESLVTGVALPWNALLALLFVGQGSFMHTKQSSKSKAKVK